MIIKDDQSAAYTVEITMKHLLFFSILFLLSFSLCEAATVSPDLQAVLQTAPSSQEVAIIINLADKVDVKQIPLVPASRTREGRAIRRNAIAAALKDKANKTQGPIKALLQSRGGKKTKPLWITNSIAVTVPASTINELSGSPQIASIELDAVVQPPVVIPSAESVNNWHLYSVNAPALWEAGVDGSGAVVASLDSGVDVNHPDLMYRWRGGSCSAPPDCPSWYDPYPIPNTNPLQYTTVPYGLPYKADLTQVDSVHIHGTHTMGTMVGGAASGDPIGVAPGAKWISAKIFSDADGTSTNSIILGALQWALAPAGDAANAPDVVNNSWTINAQNTCDTTFLSAIDTLRAAGIEVVFAAGNVNSPPATASSSYSPGNNLGVFAVGGTDFDDVIAPFSAWGPSACADRISANVPFPNIVAPGTKGGATGIWSSVPLGSVTAQGPGGHLTEYFYLQGTSMAAPHASAGAALLEGAIPGLTPDQIEEALQMTATPLVGSPPNDTSPNDIYGYGLLDVGAAYLYAFDHFGKGSVPQIAGVPSSVDFFDIPQGNTSETFQITIVNQGAADLTINPTGVSISGDFAITSDNCSTGLPISPLGSCAVYVTFSPTAGGSRTGQLSVASDDTVKPVFNLPLRGNDPIALAQGSAIVATYADIQAAGGDCSNWDDIRLQTTSPETPLAESPVFNLPLGITISLLGGYDPAFASQTGSTTISGTLTISAGTVIVGNVVVM